VRSLAAWDLVNWSKNSVVGYSADSNDMSREAEESPLLLEND
jgi:hypothetical protein